MKADDQLLRIISNETKDSIDQLPVVTPSIFASLFSQFAQKHNASLENEEELAQNLIQLECHHLSSMQQETSKNAQKLSLNTSKAINAIKDKDDKILNEVMVETEKLREEVEKLKESLYKDELTHLYNRKWLHDNYIDEKTHKMSSDGVLVIIDLNYFKIVNDTHGHVIGDKVLAFVADNFIKTSYPVVRYGGDEFLLLIPKIIGENAAIKMMNELREKILSKKLKAHENTFRVSFSFGTVEFNKGDDLSIVIEQADTKMYDDKIAIKKRITGI